jgi:hypothetical protein
LIQQRINITVIARQQLHFYLFRPVPETALAISQAPKAGEKDSGQWFALNQRVIHKKPGLQIPRSCHND